MSHTQSTYKAKILGKSSIIVEHNALPLELHQLIVWVMSDPDMAATLLPEYRRIRKEIEINGQTTLHP